MRGGDAERGLFTDSRSTIKKEEGGGSSPENMSYLRWCVGGWWVGGWGGGQAGQREETQAFIDNGQSFLQQLLATSQALFLQDGAQKELAGGVVSLFPM